MAASYFLSRTLVPTMTDFMLPAELREHVWHGGTVTHVAPGHGSSTNGRRPSVFRRISDGFEHLFERFRAGYHALLAGAMVHRRAMLITGAGFVVLSLMLVPAIGQDFFPQVDGGQFQLHLRAPPGTRVEETERLFAQVEQVVKRTIPASELELVLDNIGLTTFGVSLAVGSNATVGSADGDMLVQLKPGHKGSTWEYVRSLRRELPKQFPGVTFFFQPADMVNQVLNLGLPAPIDVQISGRSPQNFQLAKSLARDISKIPGAADVRVQQVMDAPEMRFEVDRTKAQQIGLSQRDVASDMLISLSSSGQTAPNFWLNPTNGVQYGVSVMTPQYKMGTMEDLQRTPIGGQSGATQGNLQLFGNLATSTRGVTPAVVNHYNVQPVFNVFASADRRDLGGVASAIDEIVAKARPNFPKGTEVTMRGQVESMRTSFRGLGFGILFAILLVYIVLVVNFQSWVDPLIIIMALPGALAGIVWMLFLTHTTFTVPSLMGAIMAMGVATANSVLLITFADDQRRAGRTAAEAAVDAGFARLRPVIMTALAMIIGMLPMALGLGEGGEQNAPLGRAVIGGLLMATVFTLVMVPLIYSILRADKPAESSELARDGRDLAGSPPLLRPAQ